MAYNNTIAIIGAAGTAGAIIAKGVSNCYRVLLMDGNREKLFALQREIMQLNKAAETDILNCCKDASWEADIIVFAVPADEQIATALKMKEVAACKTVINITSSDIKGEDLQQLLPHSKVVNIFVSNDLKEPFILNETINTSAEGAADDAVITAIKILKTTGLRYKITQHNNEAEHTKK